MKIVGKIFLLITGVAFFVSGIGLLVSSFSHIKELTNDQVLFFATSVATGLFSIFSGAAGFSCLFIATPRRVKRVCFYAFVILILSIASLVISIIGSKRAGGDLATIIGDAWSCVVSLSSSIVYVLGAFFLKRSYRK